MSTYIITYPRGFDAPGGGTKSFLQIVHNLQQLGNKIIALPISPRADGGLSKELVNSLLGDTPVEDFNVVPVQPSKLHYLLNGIGIAKVVKKIVREQKIDAVISWEHEGAFLIDFLKAKQILFAMIAANPSYELLFEQEQQGGWGKKIVNPWFRWRCFQRADAIFVSSQFTADELVKLLKVNRQKIAITHRGIDPLFFQENHLQDNTVAQLIFYGSFASIKGLPDALEALGILQEYNESNWQLKIAGWGNKDEIDKLIARYQLEDKVTFLGRLNPQELASQLQQSQIAILPSRAESFGRAIAEAQASELPVVSYQIGSIPEIVEHGKTGWLVPPKRPDLLAEALKEAIDNPQKSRQMGINGRKRTAELFSWSKTARTIDSFLQKLNHNPNP